MSGVWTRRGLAAGWRSQPFSSADLLCATAGEHHKQIYIEDNEVCGTRGRLSGDVHSAHVMLELGGGGSGGGGGSWRLRCVRPAPPAAELRLWLAPDVLAAADLPFLTLTHIKGKNNYTCDECKIEYEEPNPLKIHMFLSCKPFSEELFWSRVVSRVERALPPPAPLGLAPALSAFRPLALARLAAPAAVEAAAAAWGRRVGGGHACLYCGRVYSRRYGLKIHIRTHTGYKPLECSHCGRAFADPSNLNKHLRLHRAATAAAARHACPACGVALARRRDLERHLRARHPDYTLHTLLHEP